MRDHSKRSAVAYVRSTQLTHSDPQAITAHGPECRFVSGLGAVPISTTILKAWRVRPCARCVPYQLEPQ